MQEKKFPSPWCLLISLPPKCTIWALIGQLKIQLLHLSLSQMLPSYVFFLTLRPLVSAQGDHAQERAALVHVTPWKEAPGPSFLWLWHEPAHLRAFDQPFPIPSVTFLHPWQGKDLAFYTSPKSRTQSPWEPGMRWVKTRPGIQCTVSPPKHLYQITCKHYTESTQALKEIFVPQQLVPSSDAQGTHLVGSSFIHPLFLNGHLIKGFTRFLNGCIPQEEKDTRTNHSRTKLNLINAIWIMCFWGRQGMRKLI